jgi:cellulose synthase (UDP-forming)
MRLPPDLYYGSLRDLALHLSYRYNGVPLIDSSTLQTYMNSAYVSSTPMPRTDQASTVLETTVPVPVGDMRPFTNSAAFKFDFQPARDAICMASLPLNLQGAVLKDSYLDLAELPHWTTLPNLELFANAGYPFTRMADLADTTVVLPDRPTPQELELFLSMIGHFSAQTGYPALNLTVTDAAGMTAGRGKDYLVMGTVADQAAFNTFDGALPVTVDEAGLHIHDTSDLYTRIRDGWWRARLWGPAWERVWSYLRLGPSSQPGQLDIAGAMPDVLIEGFEWPRRSGRSAVVMVLRNPEAVASFLPAFLRVSETSAIAQSVSVLRDGQFSSYRMGSDAYHVGALSPLVHATLLLQEYPGLIVLLAVISAVLMAGLVRAMLSRNARARLQGNTV